MATRSSNGLYRVLIGQPVERWYLRPVADDIPTLTPRQQLSIRRQSIIGWLQSVLLIVVVAQSLFAGLLRALPPGTRNALAFLHRIEWAAYLAIALVAAYVIAGWTEQIVLTNRFYLLAWRLGRPRIATAKTARYLQVGYLMFAVLMIAAVLWVRVHGFLVQPVQ
jgi:hypothetical protein